MNKKEYILKVLEKISKKSEIAMWMELLLKNQNFDDKNIDFLFDFLKSKLIEFMEMENKEKIKNLSKILKKINDEESIEKNKNIEEEFLKLINNL